MKEDILLENKICVKINIMEVVNDYYIIIKYCKIRMWVQVKFNKVIMIYRLG